MMTNMGDMPLREIDESKNNWRHDKEVQKNIRDERSGDTFSLFWLFVSVVVAVAGAAYAMNQFVLVPMEVLPFIQKQNLLPRIALYALSVVVAVVLAFVVALCCFATYLYTMSRMWAPSHGNPEKYLNFTDASFERKWRGRAIPMETMYEAYFAGKFDFKGDVLDTLRNHRREFVAFRFNLEHVRFFVTQWIPELLAHTKAQDESQVRDHYDRGNDFYNAFLGSSMVYTSGVRLSPSDTLEDMQHQKLDLVFEKIQLQRGERLLDIGCGWGTLVNRAVELHDADATGVTLSTEQVAWGTEVAESKGTRVPNFLRMDYRDIPKQRFNKITCLEMAEHVGVKNFTTFLLQVRDLLDDDGVFFMQIAGLRRIWQFEDLIWGLFMAKYVFPGADASMPLGWVVDQLEATGWEVLNVDTIGCHYSLTLEVWYENWMVNQDAIVAKYGLRWFRKWEIFLSWSAIIANQGSATCYQLTLHKNLNSFNRRRFWTRPLLTKED